MSKLLIDYVQKNNGVTELQKTSIELKMTDHTGILQPYGNCIESKKRLTLFME